MENRAIEEKDETLRIERKKTVRKVIERKGRT